MTTPFDFINSINNQVKIELDKNYVQFLTVRNFSYFIDTILYASEANAFTNVSDELHYEYFFNSVKKKKRFSKWHKSENSVKIKIVAEYYGYSYPKAVEALKILRKQDLELISEWYDNKKEKENNE